ncbi:hypothetical protein RchiOBHm_Chr6g0274641 [Rosa chinensis]|uniref:Uncharacterized protein n=1 Tax=Rosa chinensis TaxID=74649 RepID=A0A2P6PRT2_ROSCH|nr:hypothetical protein RchiOBHm_Chr6g0274641 [Rosa chinensis]
MEENYQKPGNASVSFIGRGSSDKGDNWPRGFEGEIVSSGSDVCGDNTREEGPSSFDFEF